MTMAAENIPAVLLAVVLVWAGGLNIVAPDFIRSEFKGWGYPDWLRVGVGVTEWAAAVSLLFPATRSIGCALAVMVLLGVIVTFLRHGERMRLEYPLVLLALVLWVGARTVSLI
jgi:DoxX-like protein